MPRKKKSLDRKIASALGVRKTFVRDSLLIGGAGIVMVLLLIKMLMD